MNHACIFSLVPFFLTFIYNFSFLNSITFIHYIPLIIFINGLLFHGFFTNNIYVKLYDIISNLFFYMYMNFYTSNQPYCIINTLFIFVIFYINTYYLQNSNFIHIFCIQLYSLQLYFDSYLI